MTELNRLIRHVTAAVAALASFIALPLALRGADETGVTWPWLIAIPLICFVLFDIYGTVSEYRASRPRSFTIPDQQDEVNDFMKDWIEPPGRVAIYTRDMTWAHSDDVKGILHTKSKDGELVICLPNPTELTGQLAEMGAEIHTYSRVDIDPLSRFTIRKFGHGDARVAIGLETGGVHKIELFEAGRDVAFQLSNDLIRMIESLPDEAR